MLSIKMSGKLFIVYVLIFILHFAESKNILEEISSNPTLSHVAAIINDDDLLSSFLSSKSCTAFIPTNDAVEKYDGEITTQVIQYHLAARNYKAQDLPDAIQSELPGGSQLYVQKISNDKPAIRGWEDKDYFINDAKILEANLVAHAKDGSEQILHLVDEVIVSIYPNSSAPASYKNPNVVTFLENPSAYGFNNFHDDISFFYKRVKKLNLLNLFSMPGKNTFFIPYTAPNYQVKAMKSQHIYNHVVPDKLLFTRTGQDNFLVRWDDNNYNEITIEVVPSLDNEINYYIRTRNKFISIIARIIEANIPVSNGVVHFIDRPLLPVASHVLYYFLEFDEIRDFYREFCYDGRPPWTYTHGMEWNLKRFQMKDITIFAPSNDAIFRVHHNQYYMMMQLPGAREMLCRFHVIPGYLTMHDIEENSKDGVLEVQTLNGNQTVTLTIIETGVTPTVTIKGDGVTSTITKADFTAKDGVLHIIDHILAIPSITVYKKLSADPLLSITFEKINQTGWNDILKTKEEKFTIFAPSNKAWETIQNNTSPDDLIDILNRHIIVGNRWTIEEIAAKEYKFEEQNILLQTAQGNVTFEGHGELGNKESYITWNGVKAQIIDPDMNCINGRIHLIDQVFMAETHETSSGSDANLILSIPVVFTSFVSLVLIFF